VTIGDKRGSGGRRAGKIGGLEFSGMTTDEKNESGRYRMAETPMRLGESAAADE